MIEVFYRAKAINRNENFNYRTDYKNGDWVYGLISKLNAYSAEMTNEIGVSGIDVDRDTICIGTQINNANFYVGDIVEVSASLDGKYKAHGIVRFGEFEDNNENIFTGFYIEWQEEYAKYNRLSIKWWLKNRDLKIVGNIYDNPELLENKNG